MGQSHAALQALHDVITSKRHRTWQKVLETIMFKYVDLCVELKKGRYAKDGLIHYRNVCQQVNVASLEEVIKYFIKTATGRAEAATASAEVLQLDCGPASNRPSCLRCTAVPVRASVLGSCMLTVVAVCAADGGAGREGPGRGDQPRGPDARLRQQREGQGAPAAHCMQHNLMLSNARHIYPSTIAITSSKPGGLNEDG